MLFLLNNMAKVIAYDKNSSKTGPKVMIGIYVNIAILVIFDQITKYIATLTLKDTGGITLIDGLRLVYLENRGAAFGMLQNAQIFFWILTVVFLTVIIWFFTKVPKNRYYRPLNISLMFLAAGALGNFIDRITRRYVVDFIYFEVIDFPVFNVADIYVSVFIIVLILLLIFYYKSGDFAFLKKKKAAGDGI